MYIIPKLTIIYLTQQYYVEKYHIMGLKSFCENVTQEKKKRTHQFNIIPPSPHISPYYQANVFGVC